MSFEFGSSEATAASFDFFVDFLGLSGFVVSELPMPETRLYKYKRNDKMHVLKISRKGEASNY